MPFQDDQEEKEGMLGQVYGTILHRDADHHREVDQKRDYAVLTISNPISNQIGSDFGNIL